MIPTTSDANMVIILAFFDMSKNLSLNNSTFLITGGWFYGEWCASLMFNCFSLGALTGSSFCHEDRNSKVTSEEDGRSDEDLFYVGGEGIEARLVTLHALCH